MDTRSKTPEAFVIDFGCRLNQAEGIGIAAELKAAGFSLREKPEGGGIGLIIVNSCAVTAPAAAKSFAAVRKLRRENPKAFMILTGCAASIEKLPPPEGLPFDMAIANAAKGEVAKLAAERFGLKPPDAMPMIAINAKTRAHLKIQDGCDKFCAFCVVPFARGRERSLASESVLDEVRRLVDSGYKEIVLTGVNASAYKSGKLGLPELLERIAGMPGDFRIRLGSTEPDAALKPIVDLMASNSKICRFLHMPIQHGAERMLKSMGRKYGAESYAGLVAYAKGKVPGIHIGADVIAGLPGESDAIFEESYKFIESLNLANLHVFSYSKREGTRAAEMPGQVEHELVKKRHNVLKRLAEIKAEAFASSQIGTVLRVLTEKPRQQGIANGWSDNYLKVIFASSNQSRNEFYDVKVDAISKNAELSGHTLSF